MITPQDTPSLAGLADSHCHLNAAAFDGDRAAVIARAQAVGVETMIVVGLGVSTVSPSGTSKSTGWQKPMFSVILAPPDCAFQPTPWISSFFSKPLVTPSTMFASSARVMPWNARA